MTDAFFLLQEEQPHGDAMFPLKVHEVSVDGSFEEKVSCHWHEEMEFLVLTEGEAEVFIEEERYQVLPGDVIFIRPDCLHSMSGRKGEEVRFFAIDFRHTLLDSVFRDTIQRKYFDQLSQGAVVFPTFLRPVQEWQQRVYELLCGIRDCYRDGEMGYELLIKAKLYELWYLLYCHAKRPLKEETEGGSVRMELLKEIIAYLQENYAAQITLEELTERFHISDGHLCRLFKGVTRMTMTEYLNHYRVSQSTALLSETGMDIGEIAGRVGFNNISYFNKVFRRCMHMTPTEYRARQKQETEH